MSINEIDFASAIAKIHKHNNLKTIEKITEENEKILFNGKPFSSDELTDILFGEKINNFDIKEKISDNDLVFIFDEDSKNIKKISFSDFKKVNENFDSSIAIISTFTNKMEYAGLLYKILEYLNLDTFSNSVEFGKFINQRKSGTMSASKNKAYIIGGFTYDSNSNYVYNKKIEFINFKSLTNSSEIATMLSNISFPVCAGNEYFCLIHGFSGALYSPLEKMNYATAANSLLSVGFTFTDATYIKTIGGLYAIGTPLQGVFSVHNTKPYGTGQSGYERFQILYSNLATITMYGEYGTNYINNKETCFGGAAGNKLKAIYQNGVGKKFKCFTFNSGLVSTNDYVTVNNETYNCCASDDIKGVFCLTNNIYNNIHTIFFDTKAGISDFGCLTATQQLPNTTFNRSATSNSHGGLFI